MVTTTKEEAALVFLMSVRTMNSSLYFFQLLTGNYLVFITLKIKTHLYLKLDSVKFKDIWLICIKYLPLMSTTSFE